MWHNGMKLEIVAPTTQQNKILNESKDDERFMLISMLPILSRSGYKWRM